VRQIVLTWQPTYFAAGLARAANAEDGDHLALFDLVERLPLAGGSESLTVVLPVAFLVEFPWVSLLAVIVSAAHPAGAQARQKNGSRPRDRYIATTTAPRPATSRSFEYWALPNAETNHTQAG